MCVRLLPGIPGGRGERVRAAFFQILQMVVEVDNDITDMRKPFGLVFFGNIKNQLFGAVEDILGFALGGICHIADFAGLSGATPPCP